MHMPSVLQAPEERPQDRVKVFGRLVAYLRPYWIYVLGTFLLILITAGSQAAGPWLIGLAVDRFITGGDPQGLMFSMLALAGVYLANMFAMRFQIYLISWAGQNILADMRKQVMAHIHRLSLQTLEADEAGDLMSRLVNDIDALNSFFSQGLSQMLGALFALLGIIVAMIVLNIQLALAVLAVVPLMLLTTRQFARLARRSFRKTRETIGDVSADLQEELGGVKVAQAFNRGSYNVERFTERNAANRDANVSANTVTSAFAPAMDVLSTLDMAIVAGVGGFLAIQQIVSVGTVVAFLQYVQNFFRPIQTVAQVWTLAQSAFAAAERVFELLDTPVSEQDLGKTIPAPELKGLVTFEDVTFSYQPEKLVLHNVSLVAEPGQTIALVGPTGAGKTTLVSLLIRFYDPDSGKIWMDQYNICDLDPYSLRAQMGLVSQEPFLFSGTIFDNIRYGKLEASSDEIESAARAANAHDFITRLPQGYETQVGERGSRLSLGQRQLITIARAILADPRILILDEATASVDTRTEAIIQKAIKNLLKGRTSFIIAHRLSTVRQADQILVMDHGQIVERGKHSDLLQRNGLYADLYHRQFYEPDQTVVRVPEIGMGA